MLSPQGQKRLLKECQSQPWFFLSSESQLPDGYPLSCCNPCPISAFTALPRAQGLSSMKGNSHLGETLHLFL